MLAKKIIDNTNLGANNRYIFSTPNLAEAIYLVKTVTNDNTITIKKLAF